MAVLRVKGADGVWQEIPAIAGNDGVDGVTPDINVEVVSLPAGSAPTVTKKGTLEAPIFVLGIPAAESSGSSGGSGEGTGDAIPKTGNRGVLAGYDIGIFDIEPFMTGNFGDTVINKNSPDYSFAISSASMGIRITVEDYDYNNDLEYVTDDSGEVTGMKYAQWMKVVTLADLQGDAEVVLGSQWVWKDNVIPTFETIGLIIFQTVFVMEGVIGVASYIPLASFAE